VLENVEVLSSVEDIEEQLMSESFSRGDLC